MKGTERAEPAATGRGTDAPDTFTTTTTTTGPVTELAETGPSTPTGFLVGSAAACLLFGLGVLYGVRLIVRR
ncbi:hypothetical protein [Kitasatospora sp. NPDC088346]|uniref:hypothetical protein n=1 Tax=Kitasatospora sp. NPDC088346 TaxID=3364073 RepID=UPI0038289057